MLSRITRLVALAAFSGALVVAAPTGANAEGSGWTPYEQPDIDYAAGARCDFAVHGDVVRDKEEFKDVAHWPDGTVRSQLWRGALVIRWTNLDTGESVLRDQSARALAEYRADGSIEQMTSLRGAFGAGLPEGSHPGKGAYVVSGRWSSVVFAEDGTRSIVLGPKGKLENLCETLG